MQTKVVQLDPAHMPAEAEDHPPDGEGVVLGASQASTEDESLNTKSHDTDSDLDEATEAKVESEPSSESAQLAFILTTPDEPSTQQDSASSGGWMHYQERMDRLTAAVKCAIAVPEAEATEASHNDGAPVAAHTIVISFSDGQPYKIPWDACRTWPVYISF